MSYGLTSQGRGQIFSGDKRKEKVYQKDTQLLVCIYSRQKLSLGQTGMWIGRIDFMNLNEISVDF